MQALEEAAIENPERVAGLEPWQQVLFFLAACAILVTRRWDALSHAQFYAEDGRVFFADAYNRGWFSPMFSPYAGYLHLFTRIGAALALLLPFSRVPLFFSIGSLLCTALPVAILMNSRSADWGSARFRAALAALYIALPNCRETTWGLTNTFSILALSAFLVLIARVPKGGWALALDSILLIVSGLNGPFCLFMVPIALYLLWKERNRIRAIQASILVFAATVQAVFLLFIDAHVRSHTSLGASPVMLLRLTGGHVFLGAEIGSNTLASVNDPAIVGFLAVVSIAGLALIIQGFRLESRSFRLLLIYALMIIAASLAAPLQLGTSKAGVWQVLATVPGQRYWFLPTLVFVWSLAALILHGRGLSRGLSCVLLALLPVGVARDWEIPKLYESHFAQSVEQFNAAAPGTVLTLPEGCPGWTMRIVKH